MHFRQKDGTIGHNKVIDALIASGKIDVGGVTGQWEGFVQQVVEAPMPGVDRAMVIAGADRRGTIFGIYDLSARIGVSPWHYWADVPVRKRNSLFVTAGRRVDSPKVRYRGIFSNDEEPALGNCARGAFGGINAKFYERVFDLILRSKAIISGPQCGANRCGRMIQKARSWRKIWELYSARRTTNR